MEINILEIKYNNNNRQEILYPVLLTFKDEMILIDCGYPGTLPLLQEAASRQGISLDKITGLVLTHHDIDHIGAANELVQAYPQLVVYASIGEAPFINGEKKSLRLQQAEDLYDNLPEAYKPDALAFQQSLQALKPIHVDVILNENDQPFGEEVEFLPTPGHTPGHISVYLKKKQVLIAADALIAENDGLEIANPQFAMDLPGAIDSVKKISRLPLIELICYHGGRVNSDMGKKIQLLLEKYNHSIPQV